MAPIIWIVTIGLAILITLSGFGASYLITMMMATRRQKRQQQHHRCPACHSQDLTPVRFVAINASNDLVYCMSSTGDLSALWGLRCGSCGHVKIYSEASSPHTSRFYPVDSG